MGKSVAMTALPKAMKVMKALPKAMKGPLTNGPCKTTKELKGRVRSMLKESNLKKLGNLSLEEKCKQVSEGTDDPTEAALALQGTLSKLEKSKVWGQHNTHLKQHPDEAAALQASSKKDKGLAATLWFVKKSSPRFMNIQMSLEGTDRTTRSDTWKSAKQMDDLFGDEEFQRHLVSGRILWREDPHTRGVWQYKDQGDITREVTVAKNKKLSLGQEYEPEAEHQDWFNDLFSKDSILKTLCMFFI